MKLLAAVFLSCYFLATNAQTNGDLRLVDSVDGFSSKVGRVEIYMDKEWGTVMFDFDNLQRGAGQTICKQLGFQNSFNVGTVSQLNIPMARDGVPVKIQNVYCPYYTYPPDGKNHVLRCDYTPSSSTNHTNDMAVHCINSVVYGPYDTQVRLVQNPGYASAGYVEVYLDLHDSWGPVCGLGDYEGDSVCRQLGYTKATSVSPEDKYTGAYTANLDGHYKCYTSSEACFRDCFDYPDLGDTVYCSQHSWVNCTFDPTDYHDTAGGNLLCSTSFSYTLIAVGVVIAFILLLLVVIAIPTVICCCCIPGCILHSSRRRVVYETIS